MKIGKTFKAHDRKTWRSWLETNYRTAKEVWLIIPKKESHETKLPYNDAVEEALCFGWIDSIQKPYDESHTVQRYSPRKKGTPYSQTNIERLRELVRQKKVIKEVTDTLGDTLTREFIYPKDILAKIKENKLAWDNFQKFSEPYKRIRIAYIESARDRKEAFIKRLNNFISKTEKNKTFGYGGVEKYF